MTVGLPLVPQTCANQTTVSCLCKGSPKASPHGALLKKCVPTKWVPIITGAVGIKNTWCSFMFPKTLARSSLSLLLDLLVTGWGLLHELGCRTISFSRTPSRFESWWQHKSVGEPLHENPNVLPLP